MAELSDDPLTGDTPSSDLELVRRLGEGEERSVLRDRSWLGLAPRYGVLQRILEDETCDRTTTFHAQDLDLGTAADARSEKVITLKAPVESAE